MHDQITSVPAPRAPYHWEKKLLVHSMNKTSDWYVLTTQQQHDTIMLCTGKSCEGKFCFMNLLTNEHMICINM